MTDKRIVLVAVPNRETGEMIAEKVITAHLAACVNILPSITSIYTWEGKLEKSDELLLIIKTRVAAFESLKKLILSLHPYSVPEILSLPIEMGFHRYLQWIDDSMGEIS
ncbi:MAG: divalent-cation tolerance protein CutA [Candidatus Riflebacteria bacterium]|nr:divalent-cation tolerance protein CutA [Candidatus Riflebacteria bacterium]